MPERGGVRESRSRPLPAGTPNRNSDHRAVLRALTAEAGRDVKITSILRPLREEPELGGHPAVVLRQRGQFLSSENPIRRELSLYNGDEMSLHETWKWHAQRALEEDDSRDPEWPEPHKATSAVRARGHLLRAMLFWRK